MKNTGKKCFKPVRKFQKEVQDLLCHSCPAQALMKSSSVPLKQAEKSQVGTEKLETLNQKKLEEQPLQSSHFKCFSAAGKKSISKSGDLKLKYSPQTANADEFHVKPQGKIATLSWKEKQIVKDLLKHFTCIFLCCVLPRTLQCLFVGPSFSDITYAMR